MKILFEQGNEFAIATHDSKLIDLAIDLSKKYERKFEFQMLKGIRDELKPILIKNGFSVSEYIPYGTNWLPYSIRRLRERKRNILYLEVRLFNHIEFESVLLETVRDNMLHLLLFQIFLILSNLQKAVLQPLHR